MNVAAKNIDAWWSRRVDVVVAGMLNSMGSIIRIVVVGGCCFFFFFCCCCCSSAFLLPDATVVVRNTQTTITMHHYTNHEYRSQQTARTRITPPPSSVLSSDRINTKTMMVTTTTRMMMAKSDHDKEEENDIRDDDNNDNNNNSNNNNNNKNNKNNNIDNENEGDKEEKVTVADVSMMPALDKVLERARNRKSSKIGTLITKVQAFVDGPLWIIPAQNSKNNNNKITGSNTTSSLVTFKRIDGVFVLIALLLQANGFALGWIAGKITINPLTNILQSLPFSSSTMMILVLPFWPVLWAITFDQLLP